MAKKHFKPQGDNKQGYRIAIPAIVKRAEQYQFEYRKDGALVYTPVKL
jgi:hypothetical protein